MALSNEKIEEIVSLMQKRFPNWSGFSDPEFVKDEVEYKQGTITKARELLLEADLKQLINASGFDDFIERLRKIGNDNNLLWRQVPMAGDTGILYQPELDRPTFCMAMFDLLYGPGPSHERLGHYVSYLEARKLPNKWTFPTYFLFICHPDTEMFVKPMTMKWFMKFMGCADAFTNDPTASSYATIKQLAQQLKDGFREFGPRDMVDIQGLIWACGRVALEKTQSGYWVEKTLVTGRPDRISGPHALGKALWSPQMAKDGKDIYANMRKVKPGDVVFI